MIWLVVVGLCVWCVFQQVSLTTLRDQLQSLKLDLLRLRSQPGPLAEPPAEPAARTAPAAEPPPFRARVSEPAVPVEPAHLAPAVAPSRAEAVQPPPFRERGREPADLLEAPSRPGRSISDWLSENGLAWIGGGALALGGLMLVAYAAQRGLFTPGFRILAAVILGFGLIGLGEWLRRSDRARDASPFLAPSLITGAGAAILYAADWAACVLYGFLPLPVAAGLMAAISLGLLAISVLHGEALGLLAIAGIYAVPVISGGRWDGAPLDAFLLLAMTTGAAVLARLRWARAGALSLALGGLWALQRTATGDAAGALSMVVASQVLNLSFVALALRRAPSPLQTAQPELPLSLLTMLPNAAVVGASLVTAVLWAGQGDRSTVSAGLATLSLAAVSALGARARLVSDRMLIAPSLVIALAALVAMSMPADPHRTAWLCAGIAGLILAGLFSARKGQEPGLPAVIGAAGAAFALTLSITLLSTAAARWNWAIDGGFAILLGAGAIALSRRVADRRASRALAAWIGAAAEVAGLALHAGVDVHLEPIGYALLGLLLSVLAVRLAWRGFAEATAVAGLASLAALLAAPFAGAALLAHSSWIQIAAVAMMATAIQAGAWWVLRPRRDVPGIVEAASTLAVISGLVGGFLVLNRWSAPAASGALDEFTTAALRTLLLLAAGLMLTLRPATTVIGRWRAPAFLALGVAHGLVLQALVLHPWWGMAERVTGPPIADSLLLGLFAPAAILAAAARPLARSERRLAGAAVVCALLFLGIWLPSEIRRLFHGPVLTRGALGFSEAAAYGVALLAFEAGLDLAEGRISAAVGSGRWFSQLALGVGCVTQLGALFIFGALASPWWGPLEGRLHTPMLLGALYAAGIGLTGWFAARARIGGRPLLAHTALSLCGIEAFALISLAVRFAFHGGDMRAPLREASLETWTFSAVWAVYGLAVLIAGAGRKDIALRGLGLTILLVTTAKVFLFDMARLEGVVRAASFLALGAVLMLGALTARRLRVRVAA